ncbi:cytochrome c3 family protein [Gemmatimonadota bacterium]
MKKALGLAAAMLFVASAAMAQVSTTAHNMDTWLTAEGSATHSDEVCAYCHVPHNPTVDVPLWSRTNPDGSAFTTYTSASIDNTTGDPGNESLMCLSCHDGATPVDGAYVVTGDPALGTDLTDDHPVGIEMDNTVDTDLNDPAGLTYAKVFGANDLVECASCHNPHDNDLGNFLIASNAASALCVDCHNK